MARAKRRIRCSHCHAVIMENSRAKHRNRTDHIGVPVVFHVVIDPSGTGNMDISTFLRTLAGDLTFEVTFFGF